MTNFLTNQNVLLSFFENPIYEKTERGKSMCERMKYLITEKYHLSDAFRNTPDYIKYLNSLG